MWDLIVSVPDHCLSFYFTDTDETKMTKADLEITENLLLI